MTRSLPLLLVVLAACQGDPPATCDALLDELAVAIDVAAACEQPTDCGQPIAGTSCGCTRDRVARVDADLTPVQDLLEDAADADCNAGDTTCDCPEAVGYDCVEGACAFNLVDRYPYLPACPTPGDAYELDGITVEGDELVADLGYGGGCQPHTFALCWNDQAFGESAPVVAQLTLFHDAHGDMCDAWFMEDVRLSLAPLKEAYLAAYGGTTGTIRVRLDDAEVLWTF